MSLSLTVDGDRWRSHLLAMASRHPGIVPVTKGNGYGFGLGFAVRRTQGEAVHTGSPGNFHWSGAAGTLFWCDPRRDFFAVLMIQASMQLFRLESKLRNMVYAALVEPEK